MPNSLDKSLRGWLVPLAGHLPSGCLSSDCPPTPWWTSFQSCFHGKRILGSWAGRSSAVEVLHGALLLGQSQQLLADGFDEGG